MVGRWDSGVESLCARFVGPHCEGKVDLLVCHSPLEPSLRRQHTLTPCGLRHLSSSHVCCSTKSTWHASWVIVHFAAHLLLTSKKDQISPYISANMWPCIEMFFLGFAPAHEELLEPAVSLTPAQIGKIHLQHPPWLETFCMKGVFFLMEDPSATTPGTTTKHWLSAGETSLGNPSHLSSGFLATIGPWLEPTHTLGEWKRAPSMLSATSGLFPDNY